MESVRPANSKSSPQSPPTQRARIPVLLRPHPSPALREEKPALEKKAEDLHSLLLLRENANAQSAEVSRLRRREIDLMKTLLEMKQVVVKQAQALCSMKRENHRLKLQLTQTQRLISENEEVLLALQLSSLEGPQEEVDVDRMTYEQILALEEEIGSVCTGLHQRDIERMEVRRVDVEMREQAPLCSVCMNDHQLTDLVLVLPQCGHFYHKPCIEQWLSKKNRCPVCQTPTIVS